MKKLIIKIGNETHELPYNDETLRFEVEEHYVPKVGDCVKTIINDLERATFFKIVYIDYDGDIMAESFVDLYKGKYTIDLDKHFFLYETKFAQTTPEELKAKYAEAGYDWDYETNEVKTLKWMPKPGDECWQLDIFCDPARVIFDNQFERLRLMAERGFLFPTEEICKEFSEHCLEYFDKK